MKNKPYTNENLSRKRFWDEHHKNRIKRFARRYQDSYWWDRGYIYKNAGTPREFVIVISYTRRDNCINEGKRLRRLCNKKIRKINYEQIENMNYSLYKRTFDYWWEIC